MAIKNKLLDLQKKCLVRHKEIKNLIVWFNGNSSIDTFSGNVVSINQEFKYNHFSSQWRKKDFENIGKK